MLKEILSCTVAAASLSLAIGPVLAQESVEEFYAGNTIDLVIGYSPGGGYDQYARLVARFLPEFIPGNPVIVPRNMPGAGSHTAVNFVHSLAPQDGTVLGTGDQAMPLLQAIGDSRVTFNVSDLNFIGTPVESNNVVATWHTSGIENIEDARNAPQSIPMASTGSATSSYPLVLNAVAGTRFELIRGYSGASDMSLAMEQGEVAGLGSNSWSSYKAFNGDWIENGRINVLVQVGLRPEPDLTDVPLLIDLANNGDELAMLELLSGTITLGRPIFTTPNVPQDRLDALRDAFDAMVENPDFLAAAEAEGLEISPVSGARMQEVVADIVGAPAEVGQRLLEATGALRE